MLVLIVVLAGYTLISNKTQTPVIIQSGDIATDFKLKTLDGNDLSLSDYKGKGVVLNFWGTFCEPCRNEMPALESEYQKYKDKGIVVIGVNASEPEKTVQAYVKNIGATFPIVFDPGLKIANAYQANELPYSIFIRPDGRVSHMNIGQMDEQTVNKYLKTVLPN